MLDQDKVTRFSDGEPVKLSRDRDDDAFDGMVVVLLAALAVAAAYVLGGFSNLT